MHRAWIISSCAELMIFLMFSSTWEAFEAYTWGLSEMRKPGGTCEASLQSSRHRANFRYFSRTRAPSILLMNKLIRPVVQCGPTSLPRSSQHRRFGSPVFAQVQALDFVLFHSVEFSHMLYEVFLNYLRG